MKKLLLLFTLLLSINSYSQVEYRYDNAGNRTARVIILQTTQAAVAEEEEEPLVLEESEAKKVREVAELRDSEEEEEPELLMDEEETIGIEDVISKQSFKIYPNPTKGQFAVEMIDPGKDLAGVISLYDISGKIIDKQEMESEMMYFDLSDSPNGVYLLVLVMGEETVTWKIIKE